MLVADGSCALMPWSAEVDLSGLVPSAGLAPLLPETVMGRLSFPSQYAVKRRYRPIPPILC